MKRTRHSPEQIIRKLREADAELAKGIAVPEYTRGTKRRRDPEFHRVTQGFWHHKKLGKSEEFLAPYRQKVKAFKGLSTDSFDPGYRRLRYVRYADDFLLGFDGPKSEAESIKARIGEFLRDTLKLELSENKTLITHARSGSARFLGYDVTGRYRNSLASGFITLRLPPQVLEAKKARYMANGKAVPRIELIHESDFAIVETYGAEYRGIVGYYALAMNRGWLQRLEWFMACSMLRTLAAKHKSTLGKMVERYKTTHYDRGRLYKCFQVKVERNGKTYTATFGGLRLASDKWIGDLTDRPFETDRYSTRSDLLERLTANECELCGSKEKVQVHHIRKLADLKVKGRRTMPFWAATMATRKRKTLIVCHRCHVDIHAGRPTQMPAPRMGENG